MITNVKGIVVFLGIKCLILIFLGRETTVEKSYFKSELFLGSRKINFIIIILSNVLRILQIQN